DRQIAYCKSQRVQVTVPVPLVPCGPVLTEPDTEQPFAPLLELAVLISCTMAGTRLWQNVHRFASLVRSKPLICTVTKQSLIHASFGPAAGMAAPSVATSTVKGRC